jgi:hypothetical protein
MTLNEEKQILKDLKKLESQREKVREYDAKKSTVSVNVVSVYNRNKRFMQAHVAPAIFSIMGGLHVDCPLAGFADGKG